MSEKQANIKDRALRAIQLSASIDFAQPLKWGQWCRDVAIAAYLDDTETLDLLLDGCASERLEQPNP